MPEQKQSRGGLSLQTLLISACAAVAAATVIPLFWRAGTLVATAMTPVIVALVSEALRKPVERVSAVAPRVARRTGTGAAVRRFDPDAARTRDHAHVGARGDGPERFDPLPPHLREEAPAPRSDDPFGLRTADVRRPRLKLALITGLAAFVIAACVVTASELALFGHSVSGSAGQTSLFGGSTTKKKESSKDDTATPTPTPGASATPTPTATVAPQQASPTPTPSATPTPAPSATASPAPTP